MRRASTTSSSDTVKSLRRTGRSQAPGRRAGRPPSREVPRIGQHREAGRTADHVVLGHEIGRQVRIEVALGRRAALDLRDAGDAPPPQAAAKSRGAGTDAACAARSSRSRTSRPRLRGAWPGCPPGRRASVQRSGRYARPHDRHEQLQPDDHRRVPANGGQVGGGFAGAPVVIITPRAPSRAKPGSIRWWACPKMTDDLHLRLQGRGTLQPGLVLQPVGPPRRAGRVRDRHLRRHGHGGHRPERDEIFDRQKKIMPGFAEYEANTTRVIPVWR